MTPAIKTQRLRLYAPYHRKPDVEKQIEWLNTRGIMRFSEQRHREHTIESQWKYIWSFDHVSRHFWEISHVPVRGAAYDQPIGTITATRDLMNKTADIGILIGNRNVWGTGYGTEAWTAVMGFLFKDGVRKIEAGCMDGNFGMLSIFRKTGMEIEGRRAGHFLVDGKPVPMVLAGKFK